MKVQGYGGYNQGGYYNEGYGGYNQGYSGYAYGQQDYSQPYPQQVTHTHTHT